ncbi:MAG: helix-turn-helix transcriptional regulator [Gammaproteobacteria bacterium]|nr:helix-turn-helix transcriptional regulator [Gammaproteobacteria bacterium]
MTNHNFAKNLRSVCDRHQSVAEVCRSLEMNRQQFNKYLSGQVYPSRHNLERVCKFFKLDENQFSLEPLEFDRIAASRFDQADQVGSSVLDQVVDNLANDIEALSRYEGYYFAYFHALGFPGFLIRSLVHLYRHGDRYYTRSIEHLWQKQKPKSNRRRFKYKGMAFYMADRIFITEYETFTRHTICQTILFPSYRNTVDTLSGITTGVGSLNSHMPKSTRVEYEFLGKQVDRREALKGCGLYDLESDLIDADIRERVNNSILPHEFMLTALDQ